MKRANDGEKLDETCDICSKQLDEVKVSRCMICNRMFHMAKKIPSSGDR